MKTGDGKNTDPRLAATPEADDARNLTLMPAHPRVLRVLITPPAPPPPLAFKIPPLTATGQFGSFEHKMPILLAWHLNMNAVLSFTTTQCQ